MVDKSLFILSVIDYWCKDKAFPSHRFRSVSRVFRSVAGVFPSVILLRGKVWLCLGGNPHSEYFFQNNYGIKGFSLKLYSYICSGLRCLISEDIVEKRSVVLIRKLGNLRIS